MEVSQSAPIAEIPVEPHTAGEVDRPTCHSGTLTNTHAVGVTAQNIVDNRIGIKTSAQCPCGEADQTPERYQQSCSLYH